MLAFAERLRFPAILLGSVILFASYLILLATFLAAYLSPIKTVVVYINRVGEANVELFFLLASIPCVVYYMKRLKWSRKQRKLWVKVPDE